MKPGTVTGGPGAQAAMGWMNKPLAGARMGSPAVVALVLG